MKELIVAIGGAILYTFMIGLGIALFITCFDCNINCEPIDGFVYSCDEERTDYLNEDVPTLSLGCDQINFRCEHVVPYAGYSCETKSWGCTGCYKHNCYTAID